MKRLILNLAFVFTLCSQCLSGISPPDNKKYFILDYPNEKSGLFSALRMTLAALNSYDVYKDKIMAGIELVYTRCLYYDPAYGPNVWEYYFEPICLGERKKYRIGNWPNLPPCAKGFRGSKKGENEMLAKYVRVKPHIMKIVEDFTTIHFDDFIIGVHYRGTDKEIEAPRVEYEQVLKSVNELVLELKLEKYKVFVATDEIAFLDYMKTNFPDNLIYYEDSYRSNDGKPIHFNKTFSPYKKGEDALVDCLLLSRCDYLIATCSHLSFCSTLFSPNLKYKRLNKYKLEK